MVDVVAVAGLLALYALLVFAPTIALVALHRRHHDHLILVTPRARRR